MDEIKAIKFLTVVENVMCIYRNFFCFNKRQKLLIILRVLIELLSYILIGAYNIMFCFESRINRFDYYLILILVISYVTCTCVCVILSLITFDIYEKLLIKIGNINKNFVHNLSFVKFLKQMNIWCIVVVLIYIFLNLITKIVEVINSLIMFNGSIGVVVLRMARIVFEFRYFLEYIVFTTFVTIVKTQLQYLNLDVVEATDLLCIMEKRPIEKGTRNCKTLSKAKIQQWAAIYRQIVACGKLLKSCFSGQILMSLLITVAHCILLIYRIICGIIQNGTKDNFISTTYILVIVLFYHITGILVMIYSSQRVQNESNGYKRSLAKLCVVLTIDPYRAEYKQVKDLHRLVSQDPVEIKLTSNLNVGMHLLPLLLSLALSYIIVMLQFNKVI